MLGKRVTHMYLATLLILLAPLGNSAAETAYVIIKATVNPEELPQPAWISVCEVGGECDHVAAAGPIIELTEGNYELSHIVVADDESTDTDTHFLHQLPEITPAVDSILIYGNVEVDMTNKRETRTSLGVDLELLREACAANPDIFKQYPVVNAHTGKKGIFACEAED